ncbi:hypothetical protein BJY00DRAFT_289768 [Aspergillus carlsbadensis]|nr:hypothetical protein BJY00DRAFT_289768 [Aspergillus carlsbadensis]
MSTSTRLSGVRPPADPNSVLARAPARPVSRLLSMLRAPTRANLDPPARSFLPGQAHQDGPSYLHSRFAFNRTDIPTPRPSFTREAVLAYRPSFTRDAVPTYRPSFFRHAIVEQRRLASNKPAAPTGAVRKNKPGKSVRFAEEVTVQPVTRWINEPVKHVHFAPTVEVIPVTRWIDPQEHVSRIPFLRVRLRSSHVLSDAQIDPPRKVSGSKTKRVKHVHFGETTTHTVTRWIDPAVHVSRLPIRARSSRLTGWSVIPFPKPDKSGEEARYTASWSYRPYAVFHKHTSKPCDHGQEPCSFSILASIRAKNPEWAPSMVFQHWLGVREATRQGYFVL